MRSLSEMFNVNYFLVSQTNPHIVPALNLKKRVNRTLGNVVETEWKHRQAALLCSDIQVPSLYHGSNLWGAGLKHLRHKLFVGRVLLHICCLYQTVRRSLGFPQWQARKV